MKVAAEGQNLAFWVCFSSYKAVILRRWESGDRKWRHMTTWPKVTRKWRDFTGSNLQVAFEGRELAFCVYLSSYRAVTRRRRQLRDSKWHHVTSNDRNGPKAMSFDRRSPGSGCRSKTRVLWMFELLQDVAVTWLEMTSHNLTWMELTRKWRHFTGSHLEVAVEGRKLGFCVRLSSYRAVTCRRWKSCDRKWHYVTSRDQKWPESEVISPEVTWNWG